MSTIMTTTAFNIESNESEYLKLSIKLTESASIEFFNKLNQLYHTFFILRELKDKNHCHSEAGILVIA